MMAASHSQLLWFGVMVMFMAVFPIAGVFCFVCARSIRRRIRGHRTTIVVWAILRDVMSLLRALGWILIGVTIAIAIVFFGGPA